MAAGQKLRIEWETQSAIGKKPNWLESVQPRATSLHAISLREQAAIKAASLHPSVSYPSTTRKTALGRKGAAMPVHFLLHPWAESCDLIRGLLPAKVNKAGAVKQVSNNTIRNYMDPTVRVDDRIFSGLCRIHETWRHWWKVLLQAWEDFDSLQCAIDQDCDACSGLWDPPTFQNLPDYAVCRPQSAVLGPGVDTLSDFFPKPPCIAGECDLCGQDYQICPPCFFFRRCNVQVEVEEFEYSESETKNGKTFKKVVSVTKQYTVADLITKMNEELPDFLRHHFGQKWVQLQEQHLATVQPQGWCVCSVDYPERFEMHTRAQISEEEYHKEKLLLLLVATRCHVVEQI